jgi:Fe-S cluster assembly ATP-binding protein
MLKLKDINFNIDGKQILKDMSVEFGNNKIYVITGPNGSGKSSLAKIIMGIFKQNSGDIYIDDKCINDLSIDERANIGVSYAFQKLPLFKGITVNELLDMSVGNKAIDKIKVMNMVGLCPKRYLERTIDDTLSGGELKRIELASVLSKNNDYIILDEPEAGIDLWSFDSLINTFKKISDETDVTLIIISHQHKIIDLGDEVIVFEEGKIKQRIDDAVMINCNCIYKNECVEEGTNV